MAEPKREYRSVASSLRAAKTADYVLTGTAASYNVLSKDLGGFREQIAPGAFHSSLASGDDVFATFNHGMKNDMILGRTGSGTLQLFDTPQGLNFRCQLDSNQQFHRDLHSSVKRGDLAECSFAFAVDGDDGEAFDYSKDEEGRSFSRRTVKRAKLFDIAVVNRPAYGNNATSVQARSFDYEVGRNVNARVRPAPQELSMEERFFILTGRWPRAHWLPITKRFQIPSETLRRVHEVLARKQAEEIRKESATIRSLRIAERFGNPLYMSADEKEAWKREFDIAVGLCGPEKFPWEL